MKRHELEVLVSKQHSHRALLISTVNLKLKSVGSHNGEVGHLTGDSRVWTNR